jgi:multisubunit Na+/H+ antiporter MnhF subunit
MRAYLKDIAAFIALLSFIACIAVALSALSQTVMA